jgi:predicted dinucleotide-binding enzyme
MEMIGAVFGMAAILPSDGRRVLNEWDLRWGHTLQRQDAIGTGADEREARMEAVHRIGVLGTGMVGQTLARRLVDVGYDVMVGSRSRDSDSLAVFADEERLAIGDFADAAAFGELVINATNGAASLAALDQAGAENLAGKPLLDVSNELVPIAGAALPMPAATAENCLGQRIQRAFPDAHVVKALNTMNCRVMVEPSLVPGDHVVFLSGDEQSAKAVVRGVLESFGWRPAQMIDLGGIDSAAGPEMMMASWLAVATVRGFDKPPFNWAINSTA